MGGGQQCFRVGQVQNRVALVQHILTTRVHQFAVVHGGASRINVWAAATWTTTDSGVVAPAATEGARQMASARPNSSLGLPCAWRRRALRGPSGFGGSPAEATPCSRALGYVLDSALMPAAATATTICSLSAASATSASTVIAIMPQAAIDGDAGAGAPPHLDLVV